MGLYMSMAYCQNSYLATLHDTCQIGTSSSSINSFGESGSSIVYGDVIACGLFQHGGTKSVAGQAIKLDSDASIRLPIGTVITPDNYIKINSIYESSASLVYKVNSMPVCGLAGVTAELKRVVT